MSKTSMTRKDYIKFPMWWFEEDYLDKIARIAITKPEMPAEIIESEEGKPATESEKIADAAGYRPYHRYDFKGYFRTSQCGFVENIALLHETLCILTSGDEVKCRHYEDFDEQTGKIKGNYYLDVLPAEISRDDFYKVMSKYEIDLACLEANSCKLNPGTPVERDVSRLPELKNLLSRNTCNHLIPDTGSALTSFFERPSYENGAKMFDRMDLIFPALLLSNLSLCGPMALLDEALIKYRKYAGAVLLQDNYFMREGQVEIYDNGRVEERSVYKKYGLCGGGSTYKETKFFRIQVTEKESVVEEYKDESQRVRGTVSLWNSIHSKAIENNKNLCFPGFLSSINYYKRILGKCPYDKEDPEKGRKDMTCFENISQCILNMLSSLQSKIKGVHNEALGELDICDVSAIHLKNCVLLRTKNVVITKAVILGGVRTEYITRYDDNVTLSDYTIYGDDGGVYHDRFQGFEIGACTPNPEESYLLESDGPGVTATGKFYLFKRMSVRLKGRIKEPSGGVIEKGDIIKIGRNPIKRPSHVIGTFYAVWHHDSYSFAEHYAVEKCPEPDLTCRGCTVVCRNCFPCDKYKDERTTTSYRECKIGYKAVKGTFIGYSIEEDVNTKIYPTPTVQHYVAGDYDSYYEVYVFDAASVMNWSNSQAYKVVGNRASSNMPGWSYLNESASHYATCQALSLDFYFTLNIPL